MSIWNKVLLGFLIALAPVFFFVAARTLKTRQGWGEAVERLERDLERMQAANEALIAGSGDDGIRQLRTKLFAALVNRGRVWYDTTKVDVNTDPQQQAATATVSLSDAYQVEDVNDSMTLYAFDARPIAEGGTYLGEFRVTGVGDGQIVLQSAMAMDERELGRLESSGEMWTLYEVMPRDSYQELAPLTDEELAALFPEATLEEYIRHGKPAGPDDPLERVADEKYMRKLRDYDTLFEELDRQRTIQLDQIAAAKADLAAVEAAHQDALQQVEFRKQEIAAKTAELEKLTKQRDVVAGHRQNLETELAQVRAAIEEAFQKNLALAAKLRD